MWNLIFSSWKKILVAESKDSRKQTVIFVVGPTAVGKSEWALKMAQKYNGVIFNCDSIQLYKGLDIGAAKPSQQEYELVPHHLFNIASPPQVMTTGDYKRAFDQELKKIPVETPVFLVGGTGFYFQSVEHGLYPVPKASDELRKKIETELAEPDGPLKLYNELKNKDSIAAMKISINDHYRLVRALEIIRGEQTSLTDIKKKFSEQKLPPAFRLLKIGITCDREELAQRIQVRVEKMVEMGLREEVTKLLDKGLENWSPLSSVGYAQTCEAIREKKSDQWLSETMGIATRQLAKKQKTWFKRDSEIFWIEDLSANEKADKILETFLQWST